MFKTWPVSNVSPSAGLGDLRVHDLRHTVAIRLREAGVSESTVSDVLWHSTRSMTHHYSVAQVIELHFALEQVKDDSGRWNTSLAMLKLEQKGQPAGASPQKSRRKEKRLTEPSSQAVHIAGENWRGWQDSNPRPLGS